MNSCKLTSIWFAGLFVSLWAVALAQTDVKRPGISMLKLPYVISHRGGNLLWPEHTMEAYKASLEAGAQFVEVDCYALKDGSVVVFHDDLLERTSTGKGPLLAQTARSMREIRVDGFKLLGAPWGQYRVPFLDEVLAKYGNRVVIFIEPKNGPVAGVALVKKLREYRISPDYVVVNAYSPDALKAAKAAGYKTCLNLSDMSKSAELLKKTGYWGVACPYPVTKEYIQSLRAAGLKVIAYTINRHHERETFLDWGVDGFYTDDPLYMDQSGVYRRNHDPYQEQTWAPGMLAGLGKSRGMFVAPNKWAIDASNENEFKGCLQGWLSPIGGQQIAAEWSMKVSITFGRRYEEGRWASVSVLSKDAPLSAAATTPIPTSGVHILFQNNGELVVFRQAGAANTAPVFLKKSSGAKIGMGETVDFRITTTPTEIRVERVDGKAALSVTDDFYRGAYVTFGAKGQYAEFSNVQLTVP